MEVADVAILGACKLLKVGRSRVVGEGFRHAHSLYPGKRQ